MESHEEKLHQMIRQSKINEAKVFPCLPQGGGGMLAAAGRKDAESKQLGVGGMQSSRNGGESAQFLVPRGSGGMHMYQETDVHTDRPKGCQRDIERARESERERER